MSAVVTITADGTTAAALAAMDARLDPAAIGAFMSKGPVTEYLHERTADRFMREGDSASGSWATLKDSTREARLSQGFTPDHPINVRTGDMQSWAELSPAGGGIAGTGGWSYVYPNHLPKGTLLEKVETAQRGKDKPRTVARPILVLDDEDAGAITAMIGSHVTDG